MLDTPQREPQSAPVSPPVESTVTHPAQVIEVPPWSRADIFLALVAVAVIGLVAWLLVHSLNRQQDRYSENIKLAISTQAPDHAAALAYARASDAAVVKVAALFLGFVLVFLGALYTLRAIEVSYSLSYRGQDRAGAGFKTTSPGLVMVTLGVALVVLTVYSRTDVLYSGGDSEGTPEQLQSPSTAPHEVPKGGSSTSGGGEGAKQGGRGRRSSTTVLPPIGPIKSPPG